MRALLVLSLCVLAGNALAQAAEVLEDAGYTKGAIEARAILAKARP